jgi:Tfp pilus assembly protein PilN
MRLSRGRGGNPEANEPVLMGDVESLEAPPGDLLVEEVPTSDTVTVLAAVNLLPKTYAQRAAVKRAKVFAAAAVLVALLLALLGWLVAWQKETAAQEALDAATAERTLLTAEAAKYAEVPKVFSAVADAKTQLRLAMGNEVRWSFFLNDLALTMPSGVSLDTLAVTSPAPGAPTQATAPSSAGASTPSEPTSGAGVPGLGTMSVSAKAFTYNSVANWLDSLAKLPTIADPYVGTLSAGTEEGTKIVTFSSTGNVTAEALSQRYQAEEVTP